MRLLSILLATVLTVATNAKAAVSDPDIFSALENAGTAGQFTAIADGERVVLLPSSITEIEVRAEAPMSAARNTKAAAVLGYLAAATVGAIAVTA